MRSSLQLVSIPRHVAVIMDGNGRWARAQNLPRLAGHHRGSEVARDIVRTAANVGIEYITLFAFSSENWRRDPDEVTGLMALLKNYLETEIDVLHEEGVRLRIIGERELLPNNILNLIEAAEEKTRTNKKIQLIMALSYGSRAEIVSATRALAQKVRDYRLQPEDITEELLSDHLYTSEIPDPDLLIRTSGEQRISNYLLWQLAYTEFVFVDKFWPDFTPEDFLRAIEIYEGRERRFGTAA